MKKLLLTTVLMLVISGINAQAIPWTDEHGNPNPRCLTEDCRKTGIPDLPKQPKPKHEPSGNSADPYLPETHNGFSCHRVMENDWVFHAAARPVMSDEHKAAAKAEALARLVRLGDTEARRMVCRPWMIRAGFQVAAVLD